MSSEQFLQQVTEYIRSKEAKIHVEKELRHHLKVSKQAWEKRGYSAADAEQKAIMEMGSAAKLGKSMNKIHRPKWDFWLIGTICFLILAGFIPVMTFDSSIMYGDGMQGYFIENKIFHTIVGLLTITILMFYDYRKMQRYSLLLYSLGCLLLAMLAFMPNTARNGEAMFAIGPLAISGWSALPFLLVALAHFFTKPSFKLWQAMFICLLPIWLILQLPNLALAFIYTAVMSVLFFFSRFTRKIKQVIGGLSIAFLGCCILFFDLYANQLAPYQLARLNGFFSPQMYADAEGYDYLNLQKIIANSGWFGAETPIAFREAHTIYAFVQIIQAVGFGVSIVIILLLLGVASRILWIFRTMPLSFGKMLALAAVALYSFQSIYSILMVLGYLPILEVPLPFISYGITPMMLNAILIGLVLSVYRRKSVMTAES